LQKRIISSVAATSSFLVPVGFHQLEDVPFAITEKHDSKPGNDVTEIDDGSGSMPSASGDLRIV
jgi:hypothetical protein